jgi:hypothetical protein
MRVRVIYILSGIKPMDTGRCSGSFFQHICINSRNTTGHSLGIVGVKPSSLFVYIDRVLHDIRDLVSFTECILQPQTQEIKFDCKNNLIRVEIFNGSLSANGSRLATISYTVQMVKAMRHIPHLHM